MRSITLSILALFALQAAGCAVPPGQIKKQSAPGQVMKRTGVNPASGAHPGVHRGSHHGAHPGDNDKH